MFPKRALSSSSSHAANVEHRHDCTWQWLLPDFFTTSVEYSACFQCFLESWYGQPVHAFWYSKWCGAAYFVSQLSLELVTCRFSAIYRFFGDFRVIFVSHAWLHENFTKYDIFWFGEAGERVYFGVFVTATFWLRFCMIFTQAYAFRLLVNVSWWLHWQYVGY